VGRICYAGARHYGETFFSSNSGFLTKCTWLNVLGLEFQTLCWQTFVRSGRCAYFSSSPMVFSVLLCKRQGRLFPCIWYWSWLVKIVIKEINYHYLDSSFLLHGHPQWPVQCSHPKCVTSVAQCYRQWLYRAPLCITLKIKIWVVTYLKFIIFFPSIKKKII
jgi:hypothetical protein